mmetsp:Transcript_11535/g.43278  ORF Transcript_11535/g.43278 Transcript_11535/m.43278 type:complete len:94 (+) Transcript_11535:1546-1827(+)
MLRIEWNHSPPRPRLCFPSNSHIQAELAERVHSLIDTFTYTSSLPMHSHTQTPTPKYTHSASQNNSYIPTCSLGPIIDKAGKFSRRLFPNAIA